MGESQCHKPVLLFCIVYNSTPYYKILFLGECKLTWWFTALQSFPQSLQRAWQTAQLAMCIAAEAYRGLSNMLCSSLLNNCLHCCTVIMNELRTWYMMLMNTMHGALTSSFLSSCLCYAHVLTSFVHFINANMKIFFSFEKCDVNILQGLKIYRGTSMFQWSISLNHSFILSHTLPFAFFFFSGVLEVVVVIKKNSYMANIHKQQNTFKNSNYYI